ncbi:MAG: hypothetical protein HQL57_04595 [Magnetococcales bacterium]|nr:hypothetical protein [Magnetococcales bacterium]MBF0156442.1 hypothetical protein [Magnetococcales bacterium]
MMVAVLIGLVPLLPLLVALGIGIDRFLWGDRGEAGEGVMARSAQAAAGGSLLLLLFLDLVALGEGAFPGQVMLFPWLESGSFRLAVSFTLDRLSLPMATLVAVVGFLTVRFSVNYMHREGGFARFFAVLSLFLGAMFLLVLAGNPGLMFVGWELAGVASYLLIGYAVERTTAVRNATVALVTNRFGDAGFLIGLLLAQRWALPLEWSELVAGAGELDNLHVGVMTGGFLVAALAKSAQLPFAAWIPRALEGPTPSSAVFYGSLMVHAGVYFLLRLEPLLLTTPILMVFLSLVGLLTIVHGAMVGLVQTDVKSAFIFSIQAQVGLMFLACGVGWFELAFWHMLAHAAWRAYPFLSAPSYMHLVQGRARPVPAWLAPSLALYALAVRRSWLDALGEMLILRPAHALARDLQTFDEWGIDRVVGHTQGGGSPSSLGEWESLSLSGHAPDSPEVAWGRGMLGRALQRLAVGCNWFEERLLLRSGREGFDRFLLRLGHYLELTDRLLAMPRYLLLLVIMTFVFLL